MKILIKALKRGKEAFSLLDRTKKVQVLESGSVTAEPRRQNLW